MSFKDPEDAAIAACISLLLEVSGNPKAGNVDREHNFDDLRYEHFLISAAAAMPTFIKATSGKNIGYCIYEAIKRSMEWHSAENVHFGAFLLLIPLLGTWNEEKREDAAKTAVENLTRTNADDSIYLLKAFELSKARVMKAGSLSLENNETAEMLKAKKINIYNWMKMAPPENLIASELVNGYPISLEGSEFLLTSDLEINERIVYLYHRLLAKYPDPLVLAKSSYETAVEITKIARKALESKNPMEEFRKLDEFLLKNKLNPGTIADLVSSSIYLALHEGWRF